MRKNVIVFAALSALFLIPQIIFGIPFKVFEDDRIDVSVDAFLIKRNGMRKKALVIDSSQVNPDNDVDGTVITSKGLMNRFRWEPGMRAALCYTPSSVRSVEFSAAWSGEWHASLKRASGNTLQFPFARADYTQDYNFAWKARTTYSSQLWDVEGNHWWHLTPRGEDFFSVSTIVGLRGLYLGEHARLEYTTPPNTSDYVARTKNRLCGVQGGLCVQMNPGSHDLWSFEILPKGAALLNWVGASSWLGDQNNDVVVRSTKRMKIRGSYVLDGDFRFSYHPRRGIAHIGYRLVGLWDVALAPNQFSGSEKFDRAAQVRNHCRTAYHVVYLGLHRIF